MYTYFVTSLWKNEDCVLHAIYNHMMCATVGSNGIMAKGASDYHNDDNFNGVDPNKR